MLLFTRRQLFLFRTAGAVACKQDSAEAVRMKALNKGQEVRAAGKDAVDYLTKTYTVCNE